MRYGRIYLWRRMRRSRAPSNWPGPFFAARSWAGCTTNMFGFDLRQAQVGLRRQDLVDSTIILLNAIAREPAVAVNQLFEFLSEMGNGVAGKSERKPEAGDKRFADKTWKDSAVHRGLLQAYLAWGDSLNK